MKTVELFSGYDKGTKTKPRQKRIYKVLSVADVIAWTVPDMRECPCKGTMQFQVTVSSANHAESIKRIRNIDCKEGETVTLACTCQNGFNPVDITPSHVWVLDNRGEARWAKVNGKVKTWKRDPNRVEVSLKYGLYEHFKFTSADINAGALLLLMPDTEGAE